MPCSCSLSISAAARSPPRRLKSTRAASGRCSDARRWASAAVATGPLTSAPHACSRLFNAMASCHESSTTRIRTPLKSSDSASEDSLMFDEFIGCPVTRNASTHPPRQVQCGIGHGCTQLAERGVGGYAATAQPPPGGGGGGARGGRGGGGAAPPRARPPRGGGGGGGGGGRWTVLSGAGAFTRPRW